jgi:metal-responsive CopG/Arc/MetJ family transcriptional regulator
MKTIAITIDEEMLQSLDRLTAASPKAHNRSRLVRQAVAEFLQRQERREQENQERGIWDANIDRINAQAAAMVEEQGEP